MRKKLVSFCLCMLLVLASCGSVEPEITNTAKHESTTLELLDAEATTAEDGTSLIKVNAIYQNDAAEPQYCLSSFAVKAYQNNQELVDCSDVNGEEAVLIKEISSGETLSVHYVFALEDTSLVDVYVCTPTAEQKIIAKKIYADLENNAASTDSISAYVGEWKTDQISSVMDGVTEYETSVIMLNADGTGSYKDKSGTWMYEEEQNRIILTLTAESVGVILELGEADGKTVLKYYQDVYYRAEDFIEK